MDRKNLPGLSPLWLISLALVLGTAIVVMIPVSISGGDAIKASDWIGFAGSVVSGAMTLIAATIAWFAVKRQIDASEAIAQYREREVLAVMKAELALPLHTIKHVWQRADLALEEGISQDKREFRISTVIASFDYLPGKQKIDDLRMQSKGLSPIKERNFIGVLWWLEHSLNLPEMTRRPLAVGEELIHRKMRVVRNAREFCSNFADAIGAFDQEYANIFKGRNRRKSNIPSMIEQITHLAKSYDEQEPD
jgi:hypothetical protein